MKKLFLSSLVLLLLLAWLPSQLLWGQTPRDSPEFWPPPPCLTDDPCNLLRHSNPLDDPNIYLSSIKPHPRPGISAQPLMGAQMVECWFGLAGYPGVPVNPATWGSTCSADTFTTPSCVLDEFILGCSTTGHVAALAQMRNFVAGHSYSMYFKMKTSANINNFYVKLGDVAGLTFYSGSFAEWLAPITSVPLNQTLYTIPNANHSGWQYYCFTFTANDNYDFIYLYPQLSVSSPEVLKDVRVADLHLFDMNEMSFPNGQYEMSCDNPTLQLGNINCTLPPGGSWNWTPNTYMTGANTATPTIGPISNPTPNIIYYPVTATYSLPGGVGGCTTSLTDTIIIYPDSISNVPIIGPTSYCSADTLTFSPGISFPSGTIEWVTTGSAIIYGPDDDTTVTVLANSGNFTLTFRVFLGNCEYNGSITVYYRGPDLTITGNTPVCPFTTESYLINGALPGSTFNWSISNPAAGTVYGSTSNPASVAWNNIPGTYYVGAVVNVPGSPGCNGSVNMLVTVLAPPPAPVVNPSTGLSACDGSNNFTVTNYNPAFTYSWDVELNGTVTSASGANATTTYVNPLAPAIVSVTVTDPVTGCHNTTYINISPCCGTSGPSTFYVTAVNNLASEVFGVGTPAVSGAIINGNADLVMDQNMVFTNCTFNMNTNTKIDVQATKLLDLQTCTLKACLQYWDGVYVHNGTAKVNSKNSYFRDAKNAIYSKNGGKYTVEGSTFNLNYVGIKVEDWNNLDVSQARVHSSKFQGGTLSWNAQPCFAGVQTKNVHGLIIGNQSATAVFPALVDSFTRINYGVHSVGSYISVVGCRFVVMTTNASYLFSGVGIYMEGNHPTEWIDFSLGDINKNYIGLNRKTNTFLQNEFSQSPHGVVTFQTRHNRIEKNTFTNMTTTGITCLWNKKSCLTNIDQNTMTNPAISTYTSPAHNGITIIESSQSLSANYRVTKNTIAGFVQGIRDNLSFKPIINFNTLIQPSVPASLQSIGIHGVSTSTSTINENVVNLPSGFATNTMGIFNESSPIGTDKCNRISKGYMGMVNAGPSPNTKYACNIMTGCIAGFYNNAGYMGNQFTGSNLSQENQFNSCPTFVANYSPVSIDTWFKRTIGSTFIIDPPGPGGNNVNLNGITAWETATIGNSTPPPSCGCLFSTPLPEPPTGEGFNQQETDSLRNVFYTTMTSEMGIRDEKYDFQSKDVMYKMIVADSAMTTDSEMLDFLSNENTTSIGVINKNSMETGKHGDVLANDIVDTTAIDTAMAHVATRKAENEGMATTNEIEGVCQDLYRIMLNAEKRALENEMQGLNTGPYYSPAEKLYPLTTSERDSVIQIAQLCPYEIGSCVYEARSLLFVLGIAYSDNGCELAANQKAMAIPGELAKKPHWIKLYPNPATTEVYVEVEEVLLSLQPTMFLMDITGKVVWTNTLNAMPYRLNTENLGSGVYLLQISTGTGVKEVRQLIISH